MPKRISNRKLTIDRVELAGLISAVVGIFLLSLSWSFDYDIIFLISGSLMDVFGPIISINIVDKKKNIILYESIVIFIIKISKSRESR